MFNFLNTFFRKDIDSICKKYGIKNYTINKDQSIDVDGDVDLYNKRLTKLPLKFRKVYGNFDCSVNKIKSLKGSPNWVGKDFDCKVNLLKTLEDGPENVLGSYMCEGNRLVNFKGFPENHDGYINFMCNPINNLFEDIEYDKRVKFMYWCNEYDVITDNGVIIHERIDEVYYKLYPHRGYERIRNDDPGFYTQ